MTDYFKCRDCGRMTEVPYGVWPECECRDGDYSGIWTDDFDSATEEEYWDWYNEHGED